MKVELDLIKALVAEGVDGVVDGWTTVADDIIGMADWGAIWQVVVSHPEHGLFALEYEANGEIGNNWDDFEIGRKPYLVDLTPVEARVVSVVKYVERDSNATT